ncbi:MAG: divergent PAP2 family protein [bacterium]|nr:divergent PAP2 family protein [bacterium]
MSWQFIAAPIIALLVSQLIKLVTNDVKGDFNLKGALTSYGGMPSSHTAFVISLATIIGLRVGFASPVFAVCAVFSVLIIRDALGLRQEMSKQAKVLEKLWNNSVLRGKDKSPDLRTVIGHTISEVIVGGLVGILIALFFYFL